MSVTYKHMKKLVFNDNYDELVNELLDSIKKTLTIHHRSFGCYDMSFIIRVEALCSVYGNTFKITDSALDDIRVNEYVFGPHVISHYVKKKVNDYNKRSAKPISVDINRMCDSIKNDIIATGIKETIKEYITCEINKVTTKDVIVSMHEDYYENWLSNHIIIPKRDKMARDIMIRTLKEFVDSIIIKETMQ